MNNVPTRFIFAICDLDAVNAEVDINLVSGQLAMLRLPYKLAEGYFEGVKEVSFVVESCGNYTDIKELILYIARAYDQTSILEITPNNEAFLVFTAYDKKEQHLGTWKNQRSIPEGEYTKCDGAYYNIVESADRLLYS